MFTPSLRGGMGVALVAVLTLVCLSLQSSRAISHPPAPRLNAALAPEEDHKNGHHDDDDDDDPGRDPEVLRFSTVGDSRQDNATPDPTQLPLSGQDAIWLQNTKAFSRILDTVHAQKAQLFIFNGDMIMGYGDAVAPAAPVTVDSAIASDLFKFYRQYAFWRGMVARTMETGTYVVPVSGNHETQWKHKVNGSTVKEAKVENEVAWRANMGDLILDTTRFNSLFGEGPANTDTGNTGGDDALATDQTQLTYSFDFKNVHFAVINTDPVGRDTHAPSKWLEKDLKAAQTRGVIRSFVFGHKPAFTYLYGVPPTSPLPATPSGLDAFPTDRDEFWAVIEKYNATYFCGHEHIFNFMKPLESSGGRAWQILVGSGGSPFEATPTDSTLHPETDRDYAWATVRVYLSGKVKITGYGFNDAYGPTTVLKKVTLH